MMIDIFNSSNFDTLENISLDDSKKDSLFLDKKNGSYINFDKKVLKNIYRTLKDGFCDTLCAVDTIIKESDTIYLIEFKNQKRESIKKHEIYSKAMESLAVLRKCIKNLDKYKVVLIVLYKDFEEKRYKKIGKTVSLKDAPKDFRLCRYERVVFDEVYTLDKSTFLKFKNYFTFAVNWE